MNNMPIFGQWGKPRRWVIGLREAVDWSSHEVATSDVNELKQQEEWK